MERLRRWDHNTEIEVQATIVKFPKEIHTKLKTLAARENRSMTLILTELAKEYIKAHANGNPQHLLTSYTENEDFLGFPNITLSPQNKRNYLKKMPEDMRIELLYNVQEWLGMLKE